MPALNLQFFSDLASSATGKSRTAVESEPSIVSASGGMNEAAATAEIQNWDRLLNRVIDWNLAPGEFDEDGYQNPTRQALDRLLPLLLELKARHQLIPDRLVIDCWGGCTLEFFDGDQEINLNILEAGDVELRRYRQGKRIELTELG